MQKVEKVIFDIERCKGCELCTTVCPVGIIKMSKEINSNGYNFPEIDNQDSCLSCGLCAKMCPDVVITVYKKDKGDNNG